MEVRYKPDPGLVKEVAQILGDKFFDLNHEILKVMWEVADVSMDWGGEDDVLVDNYPALKELSQTMYRSESDDEVKRYERLSEEARTFENKLHLAMTVYEAAQTLEGFRGPNGASSVWSESNLRLINRFYESKRRAFGLGLTKLAR